MAWGAQPRTDERPPRSLDRETPAMTPVRNSPSGRVRGAWNLVRGSRAAFFALVVLLSAAVGSAAALLVSGAIDDSPPAAAPAASLAPAVARVQRSVVALEVGSEVMEGSRSITIERSGSGVVLSRDGLIATSAHLLEGATSIAVTLPDGGRVLATIVGLDEAGDLAVIAVDRRDLTPMPIGTSEGLRPGDPVLAVGNALGFGGSLTATTGIVSAVERRIDTGTNGGLEHLVQTDAAINSGTSGGALADSSGRLVGIVCGRSTTSEGISFAIAIDTALPVLERLAGRSLR